MRPQLFTFANQLTLLRLALIPFFVLATLEQQYALALGLILAAGLSDALDGLLARLLQQRTALGAYLDPIADKLLLSTAFLVLAFQGTVPWSLTILVLSRDILIVAIAGAIILATRFRPFPPSLYGKACTVAESVAVLTVLLEQVFPSAGLLRAKGFLLWLTAALVVVSGLHYAYRTATILPELSRKEGKNS